MREILFRGKKVENGKWVYGMLCQYEQGISAKIMPDSFGAFEIEMAYCVNPDTVSQYTGLDDKNGKRIFVGDVIEFQFDNDDTKKRIGRVYFEKFRAVFAIAMGRNGSSMVNNDLFKYVRNGNRVAVIGNIHDNQRRNCGQVEGVMAMDSCKYCTSGEVIAWDLCNDGIVIESDGKLHMLSGGDWEAEIKFCPMCGKRLAEKLRE